MPLTEEEVTSVKSALEAGTAIAEIEALKPLGDVVIRTTKQEKTFLELHAKEVEEKTIAPRISEIYSRLDDEAFKITGVKRTQNQKTYDYRNALLTNLQTKANESESTIADLKTQIEGDGADVLRTEIETLKTTYSTDMATKDTALETMQKNQVNLSKRMIIDSMYREISKEFIQEMPAFFSSHKDAVFSEIEKNSKLNDDGKGISMLNTDGSTMKNQHTFELVTLKSLLTEKFKDVIKKGDGSGGTGGGNNNGQQQQQNNNGQQQQDGKKEWETITMPEGIKTQVEFRDYLHETYGKKWTKQELINGLNRLVGDLPIY